MNGKICLFISNDVFAGLLIKKFVELKADKISTIFIEQEMVGSRSSLETFVYVLKKSGIRYAFYQAVELVGYQLLAKIKGLFSKGSKLPIDLAKRNDIAIKFINSKSWAMHVSDLNNTPPDLIMCIRFSKILKKDILSIPKYGVINFHGSLLPKYAGLGSVLQAIRHLDIETGGTFHTMTETVDAGKIIVQKKVAIEKDDTVSSTHLKIYNSCGDSLIFLVDKILHERNLDDYKECGREVYYSFPDKNHVNEVIGMGRRLITVRDFIKAWKIL